MVVQAAGRAESDVSENGVDLGAIYGAIIAISNELKSFKAEVQAEFRSVRSEIADLRHDVADLRHEVGELRQAVNDYHGAVIGHGVLISELDDRVTRLERRERPGG